MFLSDFLLHFTVLLFYCSHFDFHLCVQASSLFAEMVSQMNVDFDHDATSVPVKAADQNHGFGPDLEAGNSRGLSEQRTKTIWPEVLLLFSSLIALS